MLPTLCAWGWRPCSRVPGEWREQGCHVSTDWQRKQMLCCILFACNLTEPERCMRGFKSELHSLSTKWTEYRRTKQTISSSWFMTQYVTKKNTSASLHYILSFKMKRATTIKKKLVCSKDWSAIQCFKTAWFHKFSTSQLDRGDSNIMTTL